MKYLNLYEDNSSDFYIITYILGDNYIENYIIKSKESAENFLINGIHTELKEEEGEHHECEFIFDVEKLLNYYNNKSYHKSLVKKIYFNSSSIDRTNYNLYPDLQVKKALKKYNL